MPPKLRRPQHAEFVGGRTLRGRLCAGESRHSCALVAVALEVALALDPYLYSRRQYGEPREVADVAAAAARRLADRNGEGRALMSRAAALYRLGRYRDALIACQRALEIFRETDIAKRRRSRWPWRARRWPN